jgi:predicted outer membrane protein
LLTQSISSGFIRISRTHIHPVVQPEYYSDWSNKMKVKILAAVIMGLFVAGCGGGGDDNDSTASAIPSGSSGANGTASNNGTSSISSGGTQYLNQTSQAVQSQMQQSQAVAQKTSNPEVKALAQQLTTDVNVINQQITQVSNTSNVTINSNVTAQQQTQINTLNTLSGTELDRTYVAGLVNDWKSLLAATLAQARQGTDVQVRQTASADVLTIEQRLAVAEELLVILQPTEYLVDAYEDGLLEIQLGQLALQKGTNAQVKQFAQRMIDDHTQINSRVTALAKQKNVTLPTALSAEQQEIVTLISSFSAADFDKAYMDRNVLTHAEDVSKTTVVSQRGSDADIKALAAQSLPILQEHLQLAQSIDTSLQGSPLYQLGQSLTTEMQFAQLAQASSTNTQIRTLAQQILTEDQATYTQLVQLAQQENVTIPLVIRPVQVQAVLQLLRTTGADVDRQVLGLISEEASQGLQVAQSAQAGNDTGVSNFAKARVSILQSRSARVAQLTTPSGGAGSNDGGGSGDSSGAGGASSSGNGAASSVATPAGSGTANTETPTTGQTTTSMTAGSNAS